MVWPAGNTRTSLQASSRLRGKSGVVPWVWLLPVTAHSWLLTTAPTPSGESPTPASDRRVLIIAATTGYQTQSFAETARRLGISVTMATDRCHVIHDPWGDHA